MGTQRSITPQALIDAYDGILLDSYGVLVDADGGIPGAAGFVQRLQEAKREFFVVTNGSTQSPAGTTASLARKGVQVCEEQVISSGSLVPGWIRAQGLDGCKVRVMGPESSLYMVASTACELCSPKDTDFDLLIIANQRGYPFLETLEFITSALFQMFDQGRHCRLLLPCPDLIFPSRQGVGFTAGMVAHCIEQALGLRYPPLMGTFARLGKPHAPIFAKARALATGKRLVMIGDQLATDIKGANDFGIDSVLVGTGVTSLRELPPLGITPTYVMPSLHDVPSQGTPLLSAGLLSSPSTSLS